MRSKPMKWRLCGRSVLLTAAIFTGTLLSPAVEKSDCIMVKLVNGTKCCIMLDTNPAITFEGETVKIGSQTLALSEVVSYTFANSSESSIQDVPENSTKLIFSGESIIIPGCLNSKPISIVNVRGMQMAVNQTTDQAGNTIVSLDELIPGVYVLSVGSESFKFVKK